MKATDSSKSFNHLRTLLSLWYIPTSWLISVSKVINTNISCRAMRWYEKTLEMGPRDDSFKALNTTRSERPMQNPVIKCVKCSPSPPHHQLCSSFLSEHSSLPGFHYEFVSGLFPSPTRSLRRLGDYTGLSYSWNSAADAPSPAVHSHPHKRNGSWKSTSCSQASTTVWWHSTQISSHDHKADWETASSCCKSLC